MQAPGQVQRGSEECSGEGLGGRGAETGQVPAKVPVKVWEASVQTGFRRRFWKKPARSGSGCGAKPGQVQQVSGEGEGLGGFGAEPDQVQQDLRPFNSPKPS